MRQLTLEDFIKKSQTVHGSLYDYSLVVYKNTTTKVKILCPIHGIFEQRPIDHYRGSGCPYCGGVARMTTQTFIEKARQVHGDKYDYSKVEYVNNKTKVCIICHEKDILGHEHGEFWQRPNDHLSGYGCAKCNNEYKPTTKEWVELATYIHEGKYDYSKVEYINANTKVCIICPVHGEFWMTPLNHIHNKCCCPKCNSIKKSRLNARMSMMLQEYNIQYEQEKTFDWLKHYNNLYLDFYLPDYNVAIECQGEQHYRPVAAFGGEEGFKLIQARDESKLRLCKEHNIPIIYVNRRNIKIINIEDIINETAHTKK